MGSRSLACALVQHRQAEPRATRRRPWTFDRAGPQLLCVACENTGLLQGLHSGLHCRGAAVESAD